MSKIPDFKSKVFLFDIDGTLIDTRGAGLAALNEATQAVFGQPGPPLDLAGATDLGILEHLHEHFETEFTPEKAEQYFEIYISRLRWNLTQGNYRAATLDGAEEMISTLAGRSEVMGLLTGNTQMGAHVKMRHFKLDGHFPFGAYGSDHADRNELGAIALKRANQHAGENFAPGEVLVIGDTPKDISCAKALGAKCLAVATGKFSADDLKLSGADHVVESLTHALHWI